MIKTHNIPINEVVNRLYPTGATNEIKLKLLDSVFKMALEKNIQEKVENKLNSL